MSLHYHGIVECIIRCCTTMMDIPGLFQGQRLGVTLQSTLAALHSFLQLALLLYTLAMLMSLEMELSSLSEETPLSPQSLQG